MKLNSTEELDNICESLLQKYAKHSRNAMKNGGNVSFWEGKYDAIYELLMIIDSPLWYKLHSDAVIDLFKED